MMIRAGLTDADSQRFLASQRTEAREELDRALAPTSAHVDPARVHLVKGDPRAVIGEFASSLGIDLLVMGTVARSGVAGRIIGNTAEAVLNHMPCSMLVVKPDEPGTRQRRA
jgi:nucleotide-binding universal stress UspA family protein